MPVFQEDSPTESQPTVQRGLAAACFVIRAWHCCCEERSAQLSMPACPAEKDDLQA